MQASSSSEAADGGGGGGGGGDGKHRGPTQKAKGKMRQEYKEPSARSKGVSAIHSELNKEATERRSTRPATLYDVVAGRVGQEGFISGRASSSSTVRLAKPIPPDHVLFQRENAPDRYEEDDVYFADRHLPEGATLPDSDLLKAIHAYASDFYGSGAVGDTHNDFHSLDETALIAMGILLEEAAKEILGGMGDLAFVEDEGGNI